MDKVNIVVNVLVGAFSMYFASINVQTDNIETKRKYLISLCIAITALMTAVFLGQFGTVLIILEISFLLTWRLSYKLQNIVSFYMGYLVLVCLDHLYSNILVRIMRISLVEAQQRYSIIFAVFYLPVLFCLTKLLGFLLHRKLKIQQLPPGSVLGILINLAISVAIFVFGIVYGYALGYPDSVVTFNGILFLSYFIISNGLFFMTMRTWIQDNALKSKLVQYENLEAYTREVERLYHNMRSFKHDYLDILASMKGYIDKNDMEALSAYFYQEILPMNEKIIATDNRLGVLSNIKEPAVKSLLASKLMVAMEKGLHVELEVREEVDSFEIDTVDFVRVMGIFLNNAAEAAMDSSEKEITLAIMNGEETTVLIRNTTPAITIPLDSICHYNQSGKEGHSGIGLYNAKDILDSYKNIRWGYSYEAPCFTVELHIGSKG